MGGEEVNELSEDFTPEIFLFVYFFMYFLEGEGE